VKDLELTWDKVEEHLKQVPGLAPAALKNFAKYLEEGKAKKGVHFFLVEFAAGEIVMPKGAHSDYAGILVQGAVRVRDETATRSSRLPVASCWKRPGPWRRRLAEWILDRTDRLKPDEGERPGWRTRLGRFVARRLRWLVPGRPEERELSRPYGGGSSEDIKLGVEAKNVITAADGFVKRVLGMTGALWNLPRSVTLLAGRHDGDTEPCVLLLVKRYFLQKELIPKAPAFYKATLTDFLQIVLPDRLADSRLFRPTLYVEDIPEEAWPTLLALLQGSQASPLSGAAARIRAALDESLRDWLETLTPDRLGPTGRHRIVEGLNTVFKKKDLYQASVWPDIKDAFPLSLPVNDLLRFNHGLVEKAFPLLVSADGPTNPTAEACRRVVRDLIDGLAGGAEPVMPQVIDWSVDEEAEADRVIYRKGDRADDPKSGGFYLILNGKFQVTSERAGGTMLVNTLERDGYFGESCLDEGGTRGATVRAVTRGVLLKVPTELVRRLCQQHPVLTHKLRREQARMAARDPQIESMSRRPPVDPPQEVAARLARATNLLLIDMNRCTRCDQCVRACGEAHDGSPRFHRANPDLRFGRWEVAAACVHCVDAPCQYVCPVGAITFLDSGAVQVHRDRCIGCTQCSRACPYDVIDMYPPTSPDDAPSLAPPKNPDVANKCDLCLSPDRDPPCVAACPYDAAQRGSPEELFPGFSGWAEFTETER
jgi:Fe-S-cluster-containing dehydrogenase component